MLSVKVKEDFNITLINDSTFKFHKGEVYKVVASYIDLLHNMPMYVVHKSHTAPIATDASNFEIVGSYN